MAEPVEPAASSAEMDTPDSVGKVEMGNSLKAAANDPTGRHNDLGTTLETARRTESGEFAWSEKLSPAAEGTSAEPVSQAVWPRLARVDYPTEAKSISTPSHPAVNPYQTWVWVAAQVCGLGLLLGGYFLGQAWAPRSRLVTVPADTAHLFDTASKSQKAGNERTLEGANRALMAERRHDLQAARAIYEEMAKRQTPLLGAEYRLAVISLHEGDFQQTETHLNRSLLAHEEVGACYLLRASLAGMKSNFADASTQLAAAVRAHPFSAKFLFCWGESLRRDGRYPEAVRRLTETLDRPNDAPSRNLYLFKLRLAKVEMGTDDVFNAELGHQLIDPNPGGDWLLLAAAQEITRKNYVAAALRLEKAKAVLPEEVSRTYLQDYLFQTQRSRPALSSVLDVPPPGIAAPLDGPLEDPAVWTAAEADPATWPPFPTAE